MCNGPYAPWMGHSFSIYALEANPTSDLSRLEVWEILEKLCPEAKAHDASINIGHLYIINPICTPMQFLQNRKRSKFNWDSYKHGKTSALLQIAERKCMWNWSHEMWLKHPHNCNLQVRRSTDFPLCGSVDVQTCSFNFFNLYLKYKISFS